MAKVAAFFDLDRTLIDVNSGLIWAQHEWVEKNISSLEFLHATLWLGLYHFSLIDLRAAIKKALHFYRNTSSSDLEARTRAWFVSEIEQRIRCKAKEALEFHRGQGHILVLATSNSVFQAKIAAETMSLDAYLANEYEVDANDMFTGNLRGDLCYGVGKKNKAMAWAKQNDVDLKTSYFYSDSFSDVPLLAAVGVPKVVCPDPRLKRHARRQKWEVLNW